MGKSSMTGAAYGLSLVLNIEQDSYLRGGPISMVSTELTILCNTTLTLHYYQAVGARISVQDRESLPLIDEFGVDMAPGTLNSLSLQVVNISRHSYSGCVSSSWEDNKYEDQLSDQDKGIYR